MIKKLLFGVFFALVALTLASCKKDSRLPVIKNFEIGYDNSGQVIAGQELHLDADIEAPEKIDRVELEIHKEGGHKTTVILFDGKEWHLEKVYDKYKGLKNTDFHEHVDIPLNAPAGDYHVDLSVIDLKGNKAKAEGDLKVLLPTR